jgi:hypothetical protein
MVMDGNFPLVVFIIIVFFHCKLLLIVSIVASSKDLNKSMYTYVHPQLHLIHQQLLQQIFCIFFQCAWNKNEGAIHISSFLMFLILLPKIRGAN